MHKKVLKKVKGGKILAQHPGNIVATHFFDDYSLILMFMLLIIIGCRNPFYKNILCIVFLFLLCALEITENFTVT